MGLNPAHLPIVIAVLAIAIFAVVILARKKPEGAKNLEQSPLEEKKTEPEQKVHQELEPEQQPKQAAEAAVEPEPVIESEIATESQVEPEAEVKSEPEVKPEEIQPEIELEPDVQPVLEVEPAPGVEPVIEIEPVAEPEVIPESEPEPVKVAAAQEEAPEQRKKRLFERIKSGLSRTKATLTNQLSDLFSSQSEIDDDLLEELETLLLMSDVGVEATTAIIQTLTEKVERKLVKDPDALKAALKAELTELLSASEEPLDLSDQGKPRVILVVGVNGVGKTTTIGKLAKRFQQQDKSVMLAAGDTFRAAAVEQLQVWGERNDVPVIAQHTGADSASVIFDALQSATARKTDILIADTAGRLQNKENLMNELSKVVRVMKKIDPDAPHEVLLVLDAGTGQNAISQAKQFQEAVGVTGIALTKLDGTAKGGIIFAVAKHFNLPIRFIGVGEQIDDLRPFRADEFVDALFD